MKKLAILLGFILILLQSQSQDIVNGTPTPIEPVDYNLSVGNYYLKWFDSENLYPSYLADPLGNRFEMSTQHVLYSDYETGDRINDGDGYLGRLSFYAGVRYSFFKFMSKKNPKLGIELELGFMTPVIMRSGNHDLISVDGIYYLALAARPAEWLDLRFSKHHICTHIGDEFATSTVYSPVDFDVNTSQLPVRDDFILSAAFRPLHFVIPHYENVLQLYGDFGFFLPGSDFLGERQNKPHKESWFNYQAGAELSYPLRNKQLGGFFMAGNVSSYQLNGWSRNISLKAGWFLPIGKVTSRLNIGINYYTGRALANQFYNRHEEFVAFFVNADL
ncbi:MAG: hypothetical protein K9I34_01090 [Bacteroidales bacterium]|nr:hypothetical protein [Bacteroidales bacterium]